MSVSREHARIVCSQGMYLLVDLGTMSGTFVNGLPVQVCALQSGDRIAFGKSDAMYFRLDAASEPAHQTETHRAPAPDLKPRSFESLPSETVASILYTELRKTQTIRRGLQHELHLAESIQRALLSEVPDWDGFRLRAYSEPTVYVGGDFYDFIPTPVPTICGVLGDVSGKGVAASLLSAMVLGCVDARLRTGSSLEDAVQTVNELLYEKGNGRFVSAGHNPAYVYRHDRGEVQEISSNNTIVGAFPSRSFERGAIELASGDLMLIYSDGVTEAESVEGEMLGEAPVRTLLQRDSRHGVDYVKASLLDLLVTFTDGQQQNDDITFILIQRL